MSLVIDIISAKHYNGYSTDLHNGQRAIPVTGGHDSRREVIKDRCRCVDIMNYLDGIILIEPPLEDEVV